jgi:hypothetical protein
LDARPWVLASPRQRMARSCSWPKQILPFAMTMLAVLPLTLRQRISHLNSFVWIAYCEVEILQIWVGLKIGYALRMAILIG